LAYGRDDREARLTGAAESGEPAVGDEAGGCGEQLRAPCCRHPVPAVGAPVLLSSAAMRFRGNAGDRREVASRVDGAGDDSERLDGRVGARLPWTDLPSEALTAAAPADVADVAAEIDAPPANASERTGPSGLGFQTVTRPLRRSIAATWRCDPRPGA
jgi:hypothetical protein